MLPTCSEVPYEEETLAEYLARKGRLPEQTALAILNPILDGLREVHEKGFIHRDIKPQNIYLTAQAADPAGLRRGAAGHGRAQPQPVSGAERRLRPL